MVTQNSSESITTTSRAIDPEALVIIDGVGETVAASIATRYGTISTLQQADQEDLTQIDHVGPTVANRILDAVA